MASDASGTLCIWYSVSLPLAEGGRKEREPWLLVGAVSLGCSASSRCCGFGGDLVWRRPEGGGRKAHRMRAKMCTRHCGGAHSSSIPEKPELPIC